jgi:NitT/TauT family transport system substrate-binding protein
VVPYLVDEINALPDQPEFPKLTAEDFHLPRLRYVEPRPYPDELFQNTYNWLLGWGLVSQDATWDRVVENRVNQSGATARG